MVTIDFLTVPTATFRVLYVFIVLAHDRRRVLRFKVTEHPPAAWTLQQPEPRAKQAPECGPVIEIAEVGGLHQHV